MKIETGILEKYIENMKEIRLLSTPDLSTITEADEYGEILIRNFSKIGELGRENRKLIDSVIKPFLSPEAVLTDEKKDMLARFTSLLIEDDSMGEVDVHLSDVINGVLDEDILGDEDSAHENAKVISMAKKVKRDYFFVSSLTRYINDEINEIRNRAIENRNELAKYLEKDAFVRLDDEAKGMVLQFSLMGALLYENNLYPMPDSWWEDAFFIIDHGREILNDPFYHEQLPDYDWESYEFRIYYYGSFFAYSYIPVHIAKKVYAYAEEAIRFLKQSDNEMIHSAVGEEQEKDLLYMASVLAGYTSAREACNRFYEVYDSRDRKDYTLNGINKNLDTPSLYLSISKIMNLELDEEDYDRYREIENSTLDYIYCVPKKDNVYLKCITLLTNYPMYFKEVPGGMTMEEFCVKAFAAVHPPTYVHINMVARLAECMTRHLLECHPELFDGFPGCDDVISQKELILSYAYHSALCHDIGKLFIIDVISMYGRNLLDDEFSMIKSHPVTGGRIAAAHASTRDYVDVIKGHHLWYDCSHGYPADFDTFQSPYKIIIDIVMAADCLDAATDIVGRSYNRGKTLEDYEKEVADGAGTRYAPFLVELFQKTEVRKDICYLLNEGRKKFYRETFLILT